MAIFGMFNGDMYQKLPNIAQPLTESMIGGTKLNLGNGTYFLLIKGTIFFWTF